jgi:hypothetical protein
MPHSLLGWMVIAGIAIAKMTSMSEREVKTFMVTFCWSLDERLHGVREA